MEVKDLVIHEWAPNVTICPIFDKDGGKVSRYLIAFEFKDGIRAEEVIEAVMKAAQS